ncbi:cystatin-2-like [Haemaphysalis longicornis]
MARCVALSVVALSAFCIMSALGFGAYVEQDPNSNPKYLELASLAVAQRIEGLEYYDTVLDLTRVLTQLVEGMNYRLTFTIAPSVCKIGQVEYTRERCPPTTTEAKATCTAKIYEVSWRNLIEVNSYNCG